MSVPTPKNYSGSKFKGDTGVLLTKSLFFETSLDKSKVQYTLKDFDHTVNGVTYPSLYLLYMKEGDPIEYSFAQKHLDSWSHWELLCNTTWFKPYVERWRKELELRTKSEALEKLTELAKGEGRDAAMANKYLLESGWKEKKTGPGRGRPSKEEVSNAARDIALSGAQIEEDFERIVGSIQ